jgi:hypothetical protein
MKDTLALVAIVKNETKYLLEWVAHYRSIGVRNIVLYDNETLDDEQDLLGRLAAKGMIKLTRWAVGPDVSPQMTAYADAVVKLASEFEFLAFFDADEFLVPAPGVDLTSWLSALPQDVSAVGVNQQVFGSSGHEKRLPGLVSERFTMSAEDGYKENLWVKSIYRADRIDRILNPHRGVVRWGRYILPNQENAFADGEFSGQAQQIDFSLFRINHYIIKSLEEFMIKRARGGAAAATASDRLARYDSMAFFHGRDAYINKITNACLSNMSETLREEMDEIATALELGDDWKVRYLLG